MRTTLTLDDDVFEAAKRRAEALNESLGKVISELARKGLDAQLPVKKVNGLTVFDPPKDSPLVTSEMVRKALEEFP